MKKSCETCVNFQKTGVEGRHDPARGFVDVAYGQCRIGPPQPAANLQAVRWPLAWADEWCGCHTPADGGGPPPPLRVFHSDGDDGGAA